MNASSEVGRLVPFRLSSIPLSVRERGRDLAVRWEDNPLERVRIGIASASPSDEVYWISKHAWESVMGR